MTAFDKMKEVTAFLRGSQALMMRIKIGDNTDSLPSKQTGQFFTGTIQPSL